MSFARSGASVLLALAISVGITAAFTLGVPGAAVGTADQPSYTGDRAGMPRIDAMDPAGHASPGTNPFPQFEEVSSQVGFT